MFGKKEVASKINVVIKTSMGDIQVELDGENAPITVQNFIDYLDFYPQTIFHRVIPGFMIQGGGFNADMSEKKNKSPIKNEAGNGLKNSRGTLAMARTNVVNSATSQFFINLNDNGFLNHTGTDAAKFGYAVFGRVVEGMDVVDKIAAVKTTNSGMHQDVPVSPVTIESVEKTE